MNMYAFLEEHAKFPFPRPAEDGTGASTADISELEHSLIEREWKAGHAVKDISLVQKLCQALQNTLGNASLAPDAEDFILAGFSPKIEIDERGKERSWWRENSSEAKVNIQTELLIFIRIDVGTKVRTLLGNAFFEATRRCLDECGPSELSIAEEHSVEGTRSKVDYVALVDDKAKALVEAKSPLVMKKVGESLPERGIKLKWVSGQPFISKILHKAALYLGLRKMEWLFLTCHNYWVVCRLVKDNSRPFLVYSPKFTIQNSSEPFRAFLGAILSVDGGSSIERSTFNPNLEFNDINEDEDEGPLSENGIDDGLREYQCNSGGCGGEYESKSGIMISSSSSNSPEGSQVWVQLYNMLDNTNTLALPECAKSSKRRIWLHRFVASGSTGDVWECRFDGCDDLFAIKVAEALRPSDAGRRQRLRSEFGIYLTLDQAYHSGQLCNRITPRCYGAFKGDHMDILILDLCGETLNEWAELSAPERSQVYEMIQDLHRIGIIHGDLEPRNIARVRGCGFCLIDFSESRMHICKENMVSGVGSKGAPACLELRTLWNHLRERQPLH